MEPEALNRLMQKSKISYELVNPDYEEWLNTGALDVESVELLKLYASLNTLEKVEMIRKNELVSKIFLNATYATGPGLLRSYSLQHLADVCRGMFWAVTGEVSAVGSGSPCRPGFRYGGRSTSSRAWSAQYWSPGVCMPQPHPCPPPRPTPWRWANTTTGRVGPLVDNGIYDILLKILDGRDVFSIYYDIATHERDKRIVEKTLYLLTGLFARPARFTAVGSAPLPSRANMAYGHVGPSGASHRPDPRLDGGAHLYSYIVFYPLVRWPPRPAPGRPYYLSYGQHDPNGPFCPDLALANPRTGFVAHGRGCFSDDQVDSVVKLLLKLSIDPYAKLHALSNLRGLSGFCRPYDQGRMGGAVAWPGHAGCMALAAVSDQKNHALVQNPAVLALLRAGLGRESPPNTQYKCVFCVWLVSRSEEYLQVLLTNELVRLLCELLAATKVEKVIRICLLVFGNLLGNAQCLEVMVETNVLQTLTLLAYDKWHDDELYDNIHRLHAQLENKTFKLSNFERYCAELATGLLRWSILHSEKFWLLHNEKFEQDEFVHISKLVELLDSSDATTVSIACFDLGEFARLYRNGKRICKKFKVKDKVMDLITNKDRDIARQAMLCAQKLMVQHWQQVSTLA
ncbi:vacuolar ATP synthase subunit H [Theileria orientalis]|uniref:Vacuolar ATP synthase subunit H n=1 Tax=Theileria orientalis TaxID=68886 RepID=A0A976MBV4_THEOR|nr:vacuolar ATP synthase subunit H [Theileria orientalis]